MEELAAGRLATGDAIMELAILSFSFGVVAAMLVAAFSKKLTSLILFVALPVMVVSMWYFWATNGAQMVLGVVQSSLKDLPQSSKREETSKEEKTSVDADEKYLAALGQTGDLFGGINALFAALAFVGVAVAAVMQARSLQLAHEQQRQQSFEPLFFHLLSLHQSVSVTKFKMRSRIVPNAKAVVAADGTEQMVEFARTMAVLRRFLGLKTFGLKNKIDRSELMTIECRKYYEFFYSHNQDELGPHFRTLFQVFKLIDASAFDVEAKIKYANIARSTLGRDQLFLLAVNCLSSHGEEFKPYVEQYGLLKHVARDPAKETIDELVAKWCYAPSAQLGAKERLFLKKR